MKNTKFPQIFIEYYIGIDISKDTIHCYLKPANDSKEDREENHQIVDNNPQAIKSYIVSVLKDKKIVGVVMENTGGYELYAAETFTEAGYSVSVADSGQARSLKNGMGINAKTDKVDAFALALIAQRFWGDEDVLSAYEPMSKEQKKLQGEVDRVEKKLSNQGFVSKAPEQVIAAEREKQVKYSDMLAKVTDRLAVVEKKLGK